MDIDAVGALKVIRVWASCNVLVNEHVVKLCDKVLGAQPGGGIPIVGEVRDGGKIHWDGEE